MGPDALVYVTSPDCTLCIEGAELVDRLRSEFGLTMIELAWESPEGNALVEQAGLLFPPALFLDGHLLGYGRLSERRLRKELSRLAA
jgi:hypothetical protein